MKKALKLFCLCLLLLCSSCGRVNPGNQPYEPDTPAPDPHDGVFSSEFSSLSFNGDGESVTVDLGKDLSEAFGLDEGQYQGTYVFLSGDLPPHGSVDVRYDIAHELRFDLDVNGTPHSVVLELGNASEDGKTSTVGVDTVTPERIPLLLRNGDRVYTVALEKTGK